MDVGCILVILVHWLGHETCNGLDFCNEKF
jgi:hypothetical protein